MKKIIIILLTMSLVIWNTNIFARITFTNVEKDIHTLDNSAIDVTENIDITKQKATYKFIDLVCEGQTNAVVDKSEPGIQCDVYVDNKHVKSDLFYGTFMHDYTFTREDARKYGLYSDVRLEFRPAYYDPNDSGLFIRCDLSPHN